jgi:hypothetical protein
MIQMIFDKLIKIPIQAMSNFQEELCKKINIENSNTYVFPNLWPWQIFCRIDELGQFLPATIYVNKIEQDNLKITIDKGLLKNNKNELFDTFRINKDLQNEEIENFIIVMDQYNNIYSCAKKNNKLQFKTIFLCFGNIVNKKQQNVLWFEEDNLVYDYRTISYKNNVLERKVFYDIYKPKNIKKFDTKQLLLEKGFVIKVLSKEKNLIQEECKHSTLLSGQPASFAGEILCRNGKPCLLNNLSGHYRTKPRFLDSFVEHLKKCGVDLSGCQINLRNDDIH